MKQIAVSLVLILLLTTSAVASLQPWILASAYENSDTLAPTLSMPKEYINYTISLINGTLWAKVDGEYPITIQNGLLSPFPIDLPMVYPMPPQTTNIHVYLADKEISWSNYTQLYPFELHHTAIGDWWMVYSLLENVSNNFTLKIHYEHPLQMMNGSYLFLYDLNINPYLSAESNSSIAYFTIRTDTSINHITTYTTATDNIWNPISFSTTTDGATDMIAIKVQSEYGKPLLGDLVVIFSYDESHFWLIPVVAGALFIVFLLYIKRHTLLSWFSIQKTN